MQMQRRENDVQSFEKLRQVFCCIAYVFNLSGRYLSYVFDVFVVRVDLIFVKCFTRAVVCYPSIASSTADHCLRSRYSETVTILTVLISLWHAIGWLAQVRYVIERSLVLIRHIQQVQFCSFSCVRLTTYVLMRPVLYDALTEISTSQCCVMMVCSILKPI